MRKKGRILILGRGGYGRELGELLMAAGRCAETVYLDDNAPGCAGKLMDYIDPELRSRCPEALVGIGDNAVRLAWLDKLAAAGYRLPAFVHPAATVCPSVVLGAGTVVLPFAFIGAGAKVGTGCILNVGAIVDHDAALGDGVHAAPGAIIKAGAQVPALIKVDSGTVLRSPWEKQAD